MRGKYITGTWGDSVQHRQPSCAGSAPALALSRSWLQAATGTPEPSLYGLNTKNWSWEELVLLWLRAKIHIYIFYHLHATWSHCATKEIIELQNG